MIRISVMTVHSSGDRVGIRGTASANALVAATFPVACARFIAETIAIAHPIPPASIRKMAFALSIVIGTPIAEEAMNAKMRGAAVDLVPSLCALVTE